MTGDTGAGEGYLAERWIEARSTELVIDPEGIMPGWPSARACYWLTQLSSTAAAASLPLPGWPNPAPAWPPGGRAACPRIPGHR